MPIYISGATTILSFIENLQGVLKELHLPDVMDRQTESWIISLYNCRVVIILLHAHLHIMCFHYFKFHWKPPSNLGGVGHTRCNGQKESWIISPYNCRLIMILIHVHLHIMCYHYSKFHWKPSSGLGVALTRCNEQSDRTLTIVGW